MLRRDSLVFRICRPQSFALSAQTCSKAGTLTRSVTQSKGFDRANEQQSAFEPRPHFEHTSLLAISESSRFLCTCPPKSESEVSKPRIPKLSIVQMICYVAPKRLVTHQGRRQRMQLNIKRNIT
jgi:hypothetical protein